VPVLQAGSRRRRNPLPALHKRASAGGGITESIEKGARCALFFTHRPNNIFSKQCNTLRRLCVYIDEDRDSTAEHKGTQGDGSSVLTRRRKTSRAHSGDGSCCVKAVMKARQKRTQKNRPPVFSELFF
jgi:hypothetical protein